MAAGESVSSRIHTRRRYASGQATVEFALIAVPFFLTFFGVVEFSLIMASIGSFDFAARDGARVGSVLGRTDAQADQKIINAITARVQSVVMAQVTEIDIYKANPTSNSTANSCLNVNPPAAPVPVSVDAANCLKDQYIFSGGSFTPAACTSDGGSCLWSPIDRVDTQWNADYLGVRVLYQYTFLTYAVVGVGSTLNLSTYSVQRIEPQNVRSRQVPAPIASHAPMGGLDLAQAAALPPWIREDVEGGFL